MNTNKLFIKNIIKYGVLFGVCGTFIMAATKDAYSHENLANKYNEERLINYELFEKPSNEYAGDKQDLRWIKRNEKSLRYADLPGTTIVGTQYVHAGKHAGKHSHSGMNEFEFFHNKDDVPYHTHEEQYAALSSDVKSRITMEEVTDEEMDDVYGAGLSLEFHNTDLKNQEALNYFGEMLEGLEESLGFDTFGMDWSAHIYGARYNEGVTPIEFDLGEGAIILNMPNHIDKIQLFTPIDNIGNIYLTDITSDITIRIQFDIDQFNDRTGFRR